MNTFDLELRVGGHEYLARFEDNPASRKLKSGVPWKLEMADLDRLEKYCYLEDVTFPTDARRPDIIKAGQLYLFEENCLVLFLEDCRSTYRYTYLGEIIDPVKLKDYAGTSQCIVEIRKR